MAIYGTVGDRYDSLAASSGNGEENCDRMLLTSTNNVLVSGTICFSYFTCRKAEDVTGIYMYTGGTAAGATPTYAAMGVYSEALNGDLTLVASTTNDTTLFAATSTKYSKTYTSFRKNAGTRYALAVLVVSAAAMPTFLSVMMQNQPEAAVYSRRTASLGGQSTLSGLVANASLLNSGKFMYAVLIP